MQKQRYLVQNLTKAGKMIQKSPGLEPENFIPLGPNACRTMTLTQEEYSHIFRKYPAGEVTIQKKVGKKK